MIQVAPNRNQNGLIAVAAMGIVLVVFLATYKAPPAQPAATIGPSAVAGALSPSPSAGASATAAPTPTRRPVPTLAPLPTQGPCELPASLPLNAAAAPAVPKVQGQAPGSMLFASPVYLPGAPNPVAADGSGVNWNIGLWFVPAPGAEPNLVLEARHGMVVPLALSPDGTEAAVWWWPERRTQDEVPCQQGIYTIDLTEGATNRLVTQGDWSVPAGGDGDVAADYIDPNGQAFNLPNASFSFDGSLLAVIDGNTIDVVRTAHPHDGDGVRHVGSCPQWAWASNADTFVAGCESMTSAWEVYLVCCDAGIQTRSVPITAPPLPADFFSGWESSRIRGIGFTADGHIRVLRTYGFATGCDGDGGCQIPSPAWAISTIDTVTGAAVHRLTKFNELIDSDPRLSADASWFYGFLATDPPPALGLDLATGATAHIGELGAWAGWSLDGRTLYGWGSNGSVQVAVRAATKSATKDLAAIAWPDGAATSSDRIEVFGLWVGAAT